MKKLFAVALVLDNIDQAGCSDNIPKIEALQLFRREVFASPGNKRLTEIALLVEGHGIFLADGSWLFLAINGHGKLW